MNQFSRSNLGRYEGCVSPILALTFTLKMKAADSSETCIKQSSRLHDGISSFAATITFNLTAHTDNLQTVPLSVCADSYRPVRPELSNDIRPTPSVTPVGVWMDAVQQLSNAGVVTTGPLVQSSARSYTVFEFRPFGNESAALASVTTCNKDFLRCYFLSVA